MTVHTDHDRTQTVRQGLSPTEQIAVEHDVPLTLHVEESAGKVRGILEVSTEGASVAAISVPSGWQRREVRGGPLSAVTADESGATLGFTRWHLPPHVTLSFWTENGPSLLIRNISASPLLILSKRVNVLSSRVDERSVLVKEGAVRLW